MPTRPTNMREGLEYALTIDGKTTRKKFGKRDQFAPELLYFSDCILNDREPEPSGEEGMQDVKIVEALYASAKSGKPSPDPSIHETATPHRPAADYAARCQKAVADQGAEREPGLIGPDDPSQKRPSTPPWAPIVEMNDHFSDASFVAVQALYGLHVVWARSALVGQEGADRAEGRGVVIRSAAHDDHLTRVFLHWA